MADKTLAEQIQFELQFMGMMGMCGRVEAADKAYIKAQELTAELIELEKLNAALDWNDWHDKLSEDIEAENSEPVETKTDYCNRMGFDM